MDSGGSVFFAVLRDHHFSTVSGTRLGVSGRAFCARVSDLPPSCLCITCFDPYFSCSSSLMIFRAAQGPRPHSPPIRGEILAPTATGVLHNGVNSPGILSGGPARASAGPVGPDACGLLAPSWVGPSSEAKRPTSFGVRSSAPASFPFLLAGASFSRVLVSPSEWTAECNFAWSLGCVGG